MNLIDALFLCADRYAEAKNFKESSVSTFLFNDGKRLKSIRNGADIGARQISRALQRLSDNWPDGAPWPEGVDRPAPATAEAGE